MKTKYIITVLCPLLVLAHISTAQTKTTKKIEETKEIVEETNETVKEVGKLFKSVFGKKKRNKQETEDASNNSKSSNANPENTIAASEEKKLAKNSNQLKAGSIHPDAVVLDVDQLSAFNDGAAIVKKGMSTALIDPKGKFITQFNDYNFLGQYMTEGLQNGIFTVLNTNNKSAKRGFKGFINSNGKEISFQQNNYMQTSHLGNYLISIKNNMTTFYDKTGKNFTINRYFNLYNETMYLKECEQNSSLFLFKDGKYGYKSSNDKIIIQPMWEEAKCFCDGAAMVGKKNEFGEMKFGFINTSGKVIVPLMFSKKPENFSNGLAKVYSNEKTCSSCSQYHYSYINKKGDFVINSKDLKNSGMTFRPFVHGYAFSYLDVMDKQGTVISATDFLISFGIPKEIITNKKNISVQWDCKNIVNGKMMVSFKGIEGHTYKKYHALLDLVNKETLFYWYADAKIGPFDPVSGLAKVEEYGEKMRNNRKRIGYINEDGVFMIVKGEASKW